MRMPGEKRSKIGMLIIIIIIIIVIYLLWKNPEIWANIKNIIRP